MGEKSGNSPLLADYAFPWGHKYLESRLKIIRAMATHAVLLCHCSQSVLDGTRN